MGEGKFRVLKVVEVMVVVVCRFFSTSKYDQTLNSTESPGQQLATPSPVPPPLSRLCEPKYAATVGVFFTGTADNGDPYSWSPTAQVLVAGGIVPSGGGSQYMATDTVDIFREDGLDDVTGEVRCVVSHVVSYV